MKKLSLIVAAAIFASAANAAAPVATGTVAPKAPVAAPIAPAKK